MPYWGFLSSAYANIKCMYDEKNYIHNLRSHARNIYAIRQVDDLIMWISYSKTRPETKKWANREKERIIKGDL